MYVQPTNHTLKPQPQNLNPQTQTLCEEVIDMVKEW